MEEINEDVTEFVEKSEEDIQAEIESEKRKKYAELAIQANAENKVIYQHESGEYELVDQETYNTCIFDGEKWVKDISKINAINDAKIQQNKEICTSLISEATTEISILQDIIDFELQEGDEENRLKSWKKYRILLTRVDISSVDIKWPEKPN